MMSHRNRADTLLTCAMISGALGGCGGGHGSGYTSMTLMPSVMFSEPAEAVSINLGQSLSVTWSSTYASTCSGSASSATAGAFTGSQATSGTQTIVPTAAGSYSYSLNCTGTGGNVSVATPTVTVNPSILASLAASGKITTIGPTPDPIEKGGNPYGLAIAPATAGLITAGDLVACNFNDGATNTQGLGTTIVGLHPAAGAVPYRIALSTDLLGCDALTILPDDSISAAAFSANKNPLVSASGVVAEPFAADTFGGAWGEAYAAGAGTTAAAIYVSNISGTIDRISLSGDAQTSFTEIASGFCGSGTPGALFGPSGLTYDPAIDTLYIVDTSSASVVAFAEVSKIPGGGVIVNGQCTATPPTPALSFSGPNESSARVIAHGAPLFTPLSAALLSDGDLVVENADVNIPAAMTPNLMIEISPVLPGGFVGQPFQADTSGVPGALFGVAASVDAQGNQIIYFNDDNANAVMKLGF